MKSISGFKDIYRDISASSPAIPQRARTSSLTVSSLEQNALAARIMTLMKLLNIWSAIFTTGATQKPSPPLHSTASRTLEKNKLCRSAKRTKTTAPPRSHLSPTQRAHPQYHSQELPDASARSHYSRSL